LEQYESLCSKVVLTVEMLLSTGKQGMTRLQLKGRFELLSSPWFACNNAGYMKWKPFRILLNHSCQLWIISKQNIDFLTNVHQTSVVFC